MGVETTTEKSAANRDTLRDPTTPPNTALVIQIILIGSIKQCLYVRLCL